MRLRAEQGFGTIELLMAIVMMNVGILILVAALSSGTVALVRANKVATASQLADTQMEAFHAIKYTAMAFDTNSWTAAKNDSTYTSDAAYPGASAAPTTVTCATPLSANPWCLPIQTVTGPDNRPYRIDTYMLYDTPTNGRQTIKVTVVVRDGSKLSSTLARESSTFDQATGS